MKLPRNRGHRTLLNDGFEPFDTPISRVIMKACNISNGFFGGNPPARRDIMTSDQHKDDESKATKIDMEEIKRQVSKVWGRTRQFLKRGTEEVIKTTKIGKVKLDTTLLVHERNKLYQKLGERTATLIKENRLSSPELLGICQEIDALSKKIAEEPGRVDEILRTKR